MTITTTAPVDSDEATTVTSPTASTPAADGPRAGGLASRFVIWGADSRRCTRDCCTRR